MAFDKWTLLYSVLYLLVSSIADIDAEGCGKTVFDPPSGDISSPNYPQNYSNNENCTYSIWAPESSSFTLSFEAFHLESSSGCIFDWVQIRCDDSSYISPKFCGSTLPNLAPITNCNKVLILFRSDGSEVYSGFSLQYSVTSDATTTKPTTKITTTAKPTTKISTTAKPTTKISTAKPTTKITTTAKPTTKISTTSTTTTSVTTVETAANICEQPDEVPLIVVTTFLVICILGYIVLAAFYMIRRYRQTPANNDAVTTVETRGTNDYSAKPASIILYDNFQVQNDQSGNFIHIYEDDGNPYQNLGPVNDARHIYEDLAKQK